MFKSSASFYRHLDRWFSTLVCCPECREPMTIRHFYGKHACEKHHLDCQDAKEESEEEETVEEEEACGCRDFQPVPREMQGRRKDRLSEYVGFYDSLFEKPEMWEEGVEFQGGLGKNVWGIVQRYLRQDLMWFHIMVKHDMFDTFRKEMERFTINLSCYPFGACAMDG
ncbi:uncharacterized protein TNCV_3655081 [Trichonephila clavipes]|nr:uncharacterized protein TNCV_3655081 [Trichonephila clavipes]